MALIVGGTTVTGTQTLDATKLTGNLPALNGSNLTGLTSSSIPVTSYQSVGMYVMMRHDNAGVFNPGSTYSNLKVSGGNNAFSNSYALSGTYRSYSYVTTGNTHGLAQRIS